MLIDIGLEKDLWAEAVYTAVYLTNRSPNGAILFELPEEKYTGRKVKLNHLRVFGSKCVVQEPKHKPKKFDPVGNTGVFVGYSEESKGYRILMDNKSVRIERNVKVFESRKADKSKEAVVVNHDLSVIDNDLSDIDDDVSDDENDDQFLSAADNGESYESNSSTLIDDESSQFDQEDHDNGEEVVATSHPIVRRSERLRKPNVHPDYIYLCGPANFKEAELSAEKESWRSAMERDAVVEESRDMGFSMSTDRG